MTRAEFLTIPHWVPQNLLEGIPDPVVQLSEARLRDLTKNWIDWDQDKDGSLNEDEFNSAAIPSQVPGLEETRFAEWDRDHTGKVSHEDVAVVLDIAFGVRSPNSEFLRSKTGRIIDWRTFLGLNPDSNGRARRESYIQIYGSLDKAAEWFPLITDATMRTFGLAEFAKSGHVVDPVGSFLAMDVDLDGLLSPEEMEALPAWGPPGRNWLPGFDDNNDGSYSLQEFRLIPQVNLLTTWHAARDTDNDGKVSPKEFRFMPSPSLAALAMEYFRRLDANRNKLLEFKEWPCSFDMSLVPPEVTIQLRDKNDDGKLTLDEILADMPRHSADPVQQSALARYHDAFLRADSNNNKLLDPEELATDAGLDAYSPGSARMPAAARTDVTRTVKTFLEWTA